MIFLSELCKKASPRAAPMAIFSLMSHESGSIALLPEQQKDPAINAFYHQ